MEELFKGVQPHHVGILIVVKLFLDFLKDFLKPLLDKRLKNGNGDKLLYQTVSSVSKNLSDLAEIVRQIELNNATTTAVLKGIQDDIIRIETKERVSKDCH